MRENVTHHERGGLAALEPRSGGDVRVASESLALAGVWFSGHPLDRPAGRESSPLPPALAAAATLGR